MLQNILLFDTNRQIIETLRKALEGRGCEVRSSFGLNEVHSRLRDGGFDALLMGPGVVDILTQGEVSSLARQLSGAPAFIFVPSASPVSWKEHLKSVGIHWIPWPCNEAELFDALSLDTVPGALPEEGLQPSSEESGAELLGDSAVMQSLRETLAMVAQTDAPVLLRGETGTGKELAARFIHQQGPGRRHRWVAVNCAALAESLLESELFGHEKGAFTGAVRQKMGKFEFAGNGTLFLDEIGEMAPHLQAKMLRILDDKAFERVGGNRTLKAECRIVAASNIDFTAAIREKRFREDLYYRLNVVSVDLPPLRERREDIPALVSHFLRKYSLRFDKTVYKVSPQLMDELQQKPWPGNVRELENTIKSGVILSRDSSLSLPGSAKAHSEKTSPSQPGIVPQDGESLKEYREKVLLHYDRLYFEKILRENKGHISRSAQQAGIDRKTFYRILAPLGIDPAKFKVRK